MKKRRWLLAILLVLSIMYPAFARAEEYEDEEPAVPAPETAVPRRPNLFDLMKRLLPDPTQGSVEQAIGFYSTGSLMSANALESEGKGFVKLFPTRERQWATFDLVSVLQAVAEKMLEVHPLGERLQIGDMSKVSGGKLVMHASHQNGLDADVVYFRVDTREQTVAAAGFEEKFVAGGKVTDNFDSARNWDAIKVIADTGRLNRIFVDHAVKKSLCERAAALGESETRAETLRHLRPWPSHDNHFHMRLTCPMNSPQCVAQAEPPQGSGCN